MQDKAQEGQNIYEQQPANVAPVPDQQNKSSIPPVPQSIQKEVPIQMQELIAKNTEYQNQIRLQIEKTPFISQKVNIDMFIDEYKDNKFYQAFVSLKEKYPRVRKLRRDGNCFYRAFLLHMFEFLYKMRNDEIYQNILKKIEESKEYLLLAGYETIVTEDFIQVMKQALTKLSTKKEDQIEEHLISILSNKEECSYMIYYLRFVAAAYLKTNAILYEGFFQGEDMATFCSRQVEALDVEADQLQIIALINFFDKIGVEITTVLGENKYCVNRIPQQGKNINYCVRVLFTPGHYDALYLE